MDTPQWVLDLQAHALSHPLREDPNPLPGHFRGIRAGDHVVKVCLAVDT